MTQVKAPRWICRNQREQKLLEDWTNARLDELFEPSAADIAREQDHTHSPVFHHELSAKLQRGRVILAVQAKDHAAVEQLANTEELRRLALREALTPHRRGREKGESRPRDYPPTLKWSLPDALADVDHIRRIWKREYGLRNRAAAPTAMDIAARRWGIDPEVLITFKKIGTGVPPNDVFAS